MRVAIDTGLAGRLALAGALSARQLRERRRAGSSAQPPASDHRAALARAIDWLAESHEATGRSGSSRGYSLVSGWSPAFPETSGYLIGTFIRYARLTGEQRYLEHARRLGAWEIEVQDSDGGIMAGVLGPRRRPGIVFNTGMVLHGWLDLHMADGDAACLEAGLRAGEFLVAHQRPDGAWRGERTYFNMPHTYKARVAWALLRLSEASGDQRFAVAARRHLDWVLSVQQPNGWFEWANFKPKTLPNTHSIAYTLRGLLESAQILGELDYLDAAERGARPLVAEFERRGWLPATWTSEWSPGAGYECLTGTVQLGGVWLRLYQMTGNERYLDAGLRAIEHAVRHQVSGRKNTPVNGALPGSAPLFGRYAPFAFPNWATKFLADALMLRLVVLGEAPTPSGAGELEQAAAVGTPS